MLQLQRQIVYGPVRSRRLGGSLGINLLSTEVKVCSYNCLYCQYGWNEPPGPEGPRYPGVPEILESVEKALLMLPRPPAYITFSGNGEATLHPDFPSIVEGVTRIRHRIAPSSRTAILSNSSTVARREIRDALSRLDVRIMKLDAGNPETLRAYNQPSPDVEFDAVLEGLERLADVTIQALFTAGPLGNAGPDNVRDWIGRLIRIAPRTVQVYTLDRGYPSDRIRRCGLAPLRRIRNQCIDNNINAHVFS